MAVSLHIALGYKVALCCITQITWLHNLWSSSLVSNSWRFKFHCAKSVCILMSEYWEEPDPLWTIDGLSLDVLLHPLTVSAALSCQCAPVRARRSEAGRLWSGGPADGHPDKEKHVRRHAFLDGTWGHKAVRLRLKGQNCPFIKSETFYNSRKYKFLLNGGKHLRWKHWYKNNKEHQSK